MKIKGILVCAMLMVFAILFINPAFGQDQDSVRGQRPFMRNHTFAKLNLTDNQKAKIQEIRFKQQSQMIDLRASLEKEKLAMKEKLRTSDNISRDEVVSEVNKISDIKNKIALARANSLMDVYEVLTPDQRKMIKKKILDFGMERGFDGMGMMRDRGFDGQARTFMMHRNMDWHKGPGTPRAFGNQDGYHGPNPPQAPSGPDNQEPNNSN